jgi:hypothetical protein
MLVVAVECVPYHPPRAENERLLKVCASVSDKNNGINLLDDVFDSGFTMVTEFPVLAC